MGGKSTLMRQTGIILIMAQLVSILMIHPIDNEYKNHWIFVTCKVKIKIVGCLLGPQGMPAIMYVKIDLRNTQSRRITKQIQEDYSL